MTPLVAPQDGGLTKVRKDDILGFGWIWFNRQAGAGEGSTKVVRGLFWSSSMNSL